jgi:signal recognition particle subunit SRP19
MPKASNDLFIIWPEYFNSNLSKAEGRRMPKELSVPTPSADEIYNVARKLGLSPILENDKSHPSKWMEHNGRIKVPKKFSKTEIMRMIAEKLKVKRK